MTPPGTAGPDRTRRCPFGEVIENLTGSGEYHWFAGNFLKYGAAEARGGRKDASALPVDTHQLIAPCAPRRVFVSHGIPEKGDAHWIDQRGAWMATLAAQPAYRLLGARDLGVGTPGLTTPMPAVNEGLLDGDLAWRQHDGGHTDAPNWKHFIAWTKQDSGDATQHTGFAGQGVRGQGQAGGRRVNRRR